MTDNVIQLDHVRKSFGDFIAVERADFGIAQGEFFAMLGPSGCGKTTTLRMIAGFEQPTSGRVLLEGVDVSRVPPYKRNVNTVFQQYALFPHMTVADNVALRPPVQEAAQERVRGERREMLDVVRLVRVRRPHDPRSSPAASSSASRSPAHSSTSRARCCSTSRSPRSTSSCARRCSSN